MQDHTHMHIIHVLKIRYVYNYMYIYNVYRYVHIHLYFSNRARMSRILLCFSDFNPRSQPVHFHIKLYTQQKENLIYQMRARTR